MNMRYNGYSATAWPDHWTNGGTAITKTSGEHTAQIAATVKAFGDPEIFMKGDELHCSKKRMDLSDFWKFHNEKHGLKY